MAVIAAAGTIGAAIASRKTTEVNPRSQPVPQVTATDEPSGDILLVEPSSVQKSGRPSFERATAEPSKAFARGSNVNRAATEPVPPVAAGPSRYPQTADDAWDLDELISLLNMRASLIRLKIRDRETAAPKELSEFESLHAANVAAIRGRQFILSHEIVGQINSLLARMFARDEPPQYKVTCGHPRLTLGGDNLASIVIGGSKPRPHFLFAPFNVVTSSDTPGKRNALSTRRAICGDTTANDDASEIPK